MLVAVKRSVPSNTISFRNQLQLRALNRNGRHFARQVWDEALQDVVEGSREQGCAEWARRRQGLGEMQLGVADEIGQLTQAWADALHASSQVATGWFTVGVHSQDGRIVSASLGGSESLGFPQWLSRPLVFEDSSTDRGSAQAARPLTG